MKLHEEIALTVVRQRRWRGIQRTILIGCSSHASMFSSSPREKNHWKQLSCRQHLQTRSPLSLQRNPALAPCPLPVAGLQASIVAYVGAGGQSATGKAGGPYGLVEEGPRAPRKTSLEQMGPGCAELAQRQPSHARGGACQQRCSQEIWGGGRRPGPHSSF